MLDEINRQAFFIRYVLGLEIVGINLVTVKKALINVNNLEDKLVEFLVGKILKLLGEVLVNVV